MVMKKRILLLTTGGTIACTPGGNGFAPTLPGGRLLGTVPEVLQYADVHICPLLNKDSSNMLPQDWITIARAVFEQQRLYDGIVILHGTDTMAYSAAAVSFMTMGISIPVVFTGAQRPLALSDSDAPRNLRDAVCAACSCPFPGVFVMFAGHLLNGCCCSKADTTKLCAFESPNEKLVGVVKEDRLVFFDPPRRCCDARYFWHMDLNRKVLYLKITPGIDAGLLEFARSHHYAGIILEAFGLGGIPAGKDGLLEKISELRQCNIPVIVTTQCVRGKCDMSIYEVGQSALKEGVLCPNVMSKEALLAKVMWLLSFIRDGSEFSHLLLSDFCGESGQ